VQSAGGSYSLLQAGKKSDGTERILIRTIRFEGAG
jgi:hypothetical protein